MSTPTAAAPAPGQWVRYKLDAELLSDMHPGSGLGAGGIDAVVARDRRGRPVIHASHIEGVLRDAARRLHGNEAAGRFFGLAGGQHQRAAFTSLYTDEAIGTHVWRSSAREDFDNRAPKDDTLHTVEYVPKGTRFSGMVELPSSDVALLERLVQEVDALGAGRATGAGRMKLTLTGTTPAPRPMGEATGRLRILLRGLDPLCITSSATPDNLIPSQAYIPGRTLLGALAAWLIKEGATHEASMLTTGDVLVSDALPTSDRPDDLTQVEVLPAPLSLQSEKPMGRGSKLPWWAAQKGPTQREDALASDGKLKRPESDLFLCRREAAKEWTAYRPVRGIQLRNGRPEPGQPEPSLFAIEQIAEGTHFVAELSGPVKAMRELTRQLAPIIQGTRWLRVGRGGAPVEVAQQSWLDAPQPAPVKDKALLILTSDLLVRDELLRWRTALDQDAINQLFGTEGLQLERSMQESVPVRGFNGTARLWRMPAEAVRRGSVFEVSGPAVEVLAQRAAQQQWLGERVHEGFGRFRVDARLPGTTSGQTTAMANDPAVPDMPEEVIASTTQDWYQKHKALAKPGGGSDRKPSLSQWFDLIHDLEKSGEVALRTRLHPDTAGARSWEHKDAKAILGLLQELRPDNGQRPLYARFFVRWLRAGMRAQKRS